MDFKLVLISYLSSLVANLIVLLGATTVVIWIYSLTTNVLVKKYAKPILLVLYVAFIVFIHYEAWSNDRMGQSLIGFHWTYFNVELLALFDMLMMVRSKWTALCGVVLTGIWFRIVFVHFSWFVLGLFAVLLAMIGVVTYYGPQLSRHASLRLALFYFTAWATFTMTAQAHGDQQPGAWLRQWVAIIVLRLAVDTYAYLMQKHIHRVAKLQHEAEFDDLTGIRKLGAFTRDLERSFEHRRNGGPAYSLYAVDIDLFKRINDTYGHLVGSSVIAQVATELKQIARSEDEDARVYRTGGEEFIILMRNQPCDDEHGACMARRIQAAVAAMTLDGPELRWPLTVSVGESAVLDTDHNYLDAYKRADQYLYNSKRHGRNLVTVQGAIY